MTILFRFEANEKLGMGHFFRVQVISAACAECQVLFAISPNTLVYLKSKVDDRFRVVESEEDIIKLIKFENVSCIVNDILNTSIEYIQRIKTSTSARVVNLEDEGEGADLADVVINELYENGKAGNNRYYGYKYCCLDPLIKQYVPNAFREEVRRGIVLFGCTDPSNLSQKTVRVLKNTRLNHRVDVDIIAGPGYSGTEELIKLANEESSDNDIRVRVCQNVNIMDYMEGADFAISSQGRTIFDLAYFRIPTIIMAQNDREMLHTFATEANGFSNLGLGCITDDNRLENELIRMVEDKEYRNMLFDRMSCIDLTNSLKTVVELILGKD